MFTTVIFCLAFATFLAPGQATPPANPKGKARVQAPPLQAPGPATSAPGNPVAVISTSMGDFTLELFKDRAPMSVQNFLQYAAEGFYEGTIFHRVKAGYVVQGGGYTPDMAEKSTRPPILNEATNGLKNGRGTVAMARTQALRSATSQFYVNVANNGALDHRGYSPVDFGYAVFGRVLAGMEVVDKIAATPTGSNGPHDDVPATPVLITKVTVKSPQ
ncbi:MAG: peptidyl-prolyl cis-trans isomerase [Acidobacteria bacterium]|nr:peptidyl-prolyl cis-trans isomerase [Acidobacteriota bacterium]